MTTLSQSLSLLSLSLFHPRLVIIANIDVFVSSFVCVCVCVCVCVIPDDYDQTVLLLLCAL